MLPFQIHAFCFVVRLKANSFGLSDNYVANTFPVYFNKPNIMATNNFANNLWPIFIFYIEIKIDFFHKCIPINMHTNWLTE